MTPVGRTLNALLKRAATQSWRAVAAVTLVTGASLFGTTASATGSAFIQSAVASPPPSGAQQLCRQYTWACAHKASVSLSSSQELQIVKEINRRVNRSTREVTDQAQYKTPESWALQTFLGGDC